MYRSYKTGIANEVHQLVVSVSRHYYVTSSGKYKRQKKPFEARLDNPSSFTKRHIVHYLIRDHFSGLFYAELTDSQSLFSIYEFLYRAWSPKKLHPLQGLPYGLTVPKNVRTMWPTLTSFLEEATVHPIDVTSGFQSGVRDLRTWEEVLRCGLYQSGYPPDYSEVLRDAPETCVRFNRSEVRGPSKADVWKRNLPEEVYIPSSREDFLSNVVAPNQAMESDA